MLRGFAISKNSFVLLIIIAAVAVILSILSYHYSTSASTKVVDIASQEIRSNAIIQAHDLSRILANRLEAIIPLLQTLADAPALQNNEYQRARIIIDYRQNYTDDLTDFYMWLDKDGKIVWISNINSTMYQKYKGFDLSYRPYFIISKNRGSEYYSSVIESNDKVPRFYISYPILSRQGSEYNNTNPTKEGSFKGVVVAGIRVDILGNLLKNQLFPQFNSTIRLLDNNGLILYTNNQSYIGKNIFGDEFQSTLSSLLPITSHNQLNEVFRTSLNSSSVGSTDAIFKEGGINTIAYAPVFLNGTHFLSLYTEAPHNLAGDVASAIDQQKNFSILIIAIIGLVASIIAYLVLTWNKRLQRVVDRRTKELTSAYEQLKVHDKAQREFIDVAAHELRTPMQPIIGITGVLRSRLKDAEQQNLLDVVIRNSKRLQRLTEDILDVTRIESHAFAVKKVVFSINDMITRIVQDYRSQIQRKNNIGDRNLEIFFKPEDGTIFVKADSERITQVISNLIDNAIKFTSQDNGTLKITTEERIKEEEDGKEAHDDDDDVIVSIKDNGSGIDPEIMPNLFSKFATKSFAGTGLGLYISKNIIEAHGGKIWAENNKNEKGATFYFSLPIIRIHQH